MHCANKTGGDEYTQKNLNRFVRYLAEILTWV